MTDFDSIERAIEELLDELKRVLPPGCAREAGRFVGVGEYGLALETLVDCLAEEGRSEVPLAARRLIADVACAMSMNADALLSRLGGVAELGRTE